MGMRRVIPVCVHTSPVLQTSSKVLPSPPQTRPKGSSLSCAQPHAPAHSGASPLSRRASWMSLGMMVTRLAWMAQRLASSKIPTRYASVASWNAEMASGRKRRSFSSDTCWAISRSCCGGLGGRASGLVDGWVEKAEQRSMEKGGAAQLIISGTRNPAESTDARTSRMKGA